MTAANVFIQKMVLMLANTVKAQLAPPPGQTGVEPVFLSSCLPAFPAST